MSAGNNGILAEPITDSITGGQTYKCGINTVRDALYHSCYIKPRLDYESHILWKIGNLGFKDFAHVL